MYERFAKLLKEKGVTAYRVSKATGIATSTLSDWKNGRSIPKIDKLGLIAQYFDVPLSYLLGDDDIYNVGTLIKEEREDQGFSIEDISRETRIEEQELIDYEELDIPISEYLLSKICDVFGLSIPDFFYKYALYGEYIPKKFNGDVNKYEAYKKAVKEDIEKERLSSFKENITLSNKRLTENQLPDELKGLGIEYIELAHEMQKGSFTPEEIRMILKAVESAKQLKK